MAERHWIGGTGTQLYTTVTNWSATDGGASVGAIPTAGDDVFIQRGTSNIQGSDQSAVALATFRCTFGGTLGTSGTPLRIAMAAPGTSFVSTFNMCGDYGDCYLAVTNGSASGVAQFMGAGNIVLSHTSAAGVYVFTSGRTTILPTFTGSCIIWNIGSSLQFDSAASALSSVINSAGSLSSARGITTLTCMGGITYMTGTAAVTTGHVHSGSVLAHQSSGTLGTVWAYPGGVATSAGSPIGFTVTTSYKWLGGSLFDNSPVAITYTNATIKIGFV